MLAHYPIRPLLRRGAPSKGYECSNGYSERALPVHVASGMTWRRTDIAMSVPRLYPSARVVHGRPG